MTAQIGLIGLGVMGANLALNFNDHGYSVAVYNRNFDATARFMLEHAQGSQFIAAETLQALVTVLPQPRVIMLMITAGKPVDSVIEQLLPLLSPGDIIIDGGNSYYQDSTRRWEMLKALGIHFVGMGVSGGEEGARHGPSLMPGGASQAWPMIKEMFQAIAAKADGQPCCQWLGEGGAGHYVKMVHNAIEYGMMQAIAEGFEILEASQFDYDFEQVAKLWNHGSVIRGWLMELAEQEFAKDPKLENIAGRVQASGEGKWTVQESLELEVPAPVIALSLMMRNRSLQDDTVSGKVLAALRNGFGGHDVTKK